MRAAINPNSPHYLFDPSSLGWLHRRHGNKDEITAADLTRILKADPTTGSDPVMAYYIIEHLEGRLKAKRGRKSLSSARLGKIIIASVLVPMWTEEIKAERRGKDRLHLRSQKDPAVQAAEEVGRYLGIPGGRSLLNAISAQKNPKIKRKESGAGC
jgi:hypothetical protein